MAILTSLRNCSFLALAEYSDFKKEVHDIIFNLPEDLGKGACIFEPLNAWSGFFDKNRSVSPQMSIYDSLNAKYLPPLHKEM